MEVVVIFLFLIALCVLSLWGIARYEIGPEKKLSADKLAIIFVMSFSLVLLCLFLVVLLGVFGLPF